MTKIVYYLFLKPLSKLPLSWLYLLSDLLYFVIYKVVGYRKSIVYKNIKNSFPDKNKAEIDLIVSKFYHHFTDMMIESLKIFSISKKQAIERCKVLNPEVLNDLYDLGKPVILVGGHYNNWEMVALILNAQVKHLVTGIYSPLGNPFFELKFRETRGKFGTLLVPKKEIKSYFKSKQSTLNATVFGADQSPTFLKENTYWTIFLNQETPVMFGTEKYAIENGHPVVFFYLSKVKRGYYEVFFEMIEENPRASEYCSITEKHTRLLEMQIIKQPEYYLWTHKRWKHKRPPNQM